MTTLELAKAIVVAVIEFPHGGPDTLAGVVLDTLRAHDSWFCHMPTDADGETRLEDIRPYEQQELFS